jgi:glycosyltransferase involved in cell wall biosynthesis
MDDKFISVIIPAYNAAGTIGDCLRTVAGQRYPGYEVIVIDDGSTDDTMTKAMDFVKSDPKFKVISLDKNQGVAAARNRGLREAKGDIFVFTDSDCYFEPDWLGKLVVPLRKEEFGCAGGPDENPPNSPLVRRCIDYSMNSLIASGGLRRGEMHLARYSPASCNLAVKREVVQIAGMFNETLRCRGEEKEFLHRIRKEGFRIKYVREAKVWHWRRPSMGSFLNQTFRSGKGRIDILRIAPEALELAHISPVIIVGIFMVGVLLSVVSVTMRNIWAWFFAFYLLILLLDGLLGSWKLRDLRALFVIPLSSAIIHFGYGLGAIVRLLERKRGKC